jgi:pimeloyl-ACP methyl ester carboxylesterase
MLPKLLAESTRRDRPALEHDVRALIEANSREAIADAIVCLMTRPDSTPLLPSLDVPVQLVVGREDALTPVDAHERMQVALPDASLTVIEHAGHLANIEQPETFNRTVDRFLRSLG